MNADLTAAFNLRQVIHRNATERASIRQRMGSDLCSLQERDEHRERLRVIEAEDRLVWEEFRLRRARAVAALEERYAA